MQRFLRTQKGHNEDMLNIEQFTEYVRDALNHLYEPGKLHRSTLVPLLRIAEGREYTAQGREYTAQGADAPLALRRLLVTSIESLKPAADVPPNSPQWRAYEVLTYRYVQQFTQREVASQMGLSVRHLRREQEVGLKRLAAQLWRDFELTEEPGQTSEVSETSEVSRHAAPSVNDELAWLRDSDVQSANLRQVLSTAMELSEPLIARHQVRVKMALSNDVPDLAIHPIALQQALLSLLSVAIGRVPGGQLVISAKSPKGAKSQPWDVTIRVRTTSPRPGRRPSHEDDSASLDMAQRLARMYGGDLTVLAGGATFIAELVLPSLEKLPVLVIDDNEDTLRLFKRYASATRYRIVATRDPKEALALIEAESPKIIVLDIMIPGIVGWTFLKDLAQHPLVKGIPILVCTVLAQKELALSLGAADLVRKPISRTAFIETLDGLAHARESRSR